MHIFKNTSFDFLRWRVHALVLSWVIILAGVVWLAIYVIESMIQPIPEPVKRGVWLVVLLLAIIALLTIMLGGGLGSLRSPFH